MMKRIFYSSVTLLAMLLAWLPGSALADDVTMQVQAPSAVVQGQQFQLSYTINTKNVKDFRLGNIADFDILMGPNRSSQFSMVNGQTSSSVTFTYILRGQKEGTYTIPAATASAGGQQLQSRAVTIKVLPPDKQTGGQGSASSSAGSAGSARSSSGSAGSNSGQVADGDIFLMASANKTKVYEQEAILLTFKVYTTVNLSELNGKMPDLKGFHMQQVDLPQKEFELENYRGRNYKTLVWSQYVLFPQQTGTLEIPSVAYEATILQQNRYVDPFEAFFNGGSTYTKVQKTLRTPKLTIEVSPLPAPKPQSFMGGVGDFSMSSEISTEELKENEAVTYKIVLSGVGNMKLIKTPEVQFPADFEIYDPKIENRFSLKTAGLSGNKVFEYLAIPRHAGDYEIPAVEFSFFDTKTKQYKTLSTPARTLKVLRGDGSTTVTTGYVNKEDLRLLGEDIRYIHQKDATTVRADGFFFGSLRYWLCYLVPALLFVGLLVVLRRKAAESANIAKTRNRKASKVAARRLKTAKKLLGVGDPSAFYDEVLKGLWGYAGDKLGIPVAELSKESIGEQLVHHGADETLTGEFNALLSDCEFARYAPSVAGLKQENVYARAVDVMDKLEGVIK